MKLSRRNFLKNLGIAVIATSIPFTNSIANSKLSALDKINSRRLILEIRKVHEELLLNYIGEINDSITRHSITKFSQNYFDELINKRLIYNARSVCDVSNNSSNIIDSGKIILDTYVNLTKSQTLTQLRFTLG
jgi:sulfatase maturation enzyme AslB (radical SAM superfamily)